jgi:MFS family permease
MDSTMNSAWPAAIRSLRHRDFRVLWLGLSTSAMGTWMQIIGQSLLVLKLSHGSAVALGYVSLAQASAFFVFALIGGGIADNVNRRRLLLTTQSTLMALATTLGVLTSFGVVKVWMVVAVAFLSGSLLSFDQPARASLITSLVPGEDLLNAVSLQSAVFNGASTVGPAVAGILTYSLGFASNFYLNALSYGAVLWALATIRNPESRGSRTKLFRQVHEALQSIRRDAVLPALLFSYGVLLFFGPSLQLLLPVLDQDVLRMGPRVLGVLFSAAGLGAIIGAVSLTHLSARLGTGLLIKCAFPAWAMSLMLAVLARSIPIIFLALVCVGLAQSIIGAITLTALQTRGPHEQRGRAASLNTLLIMGVRPLGDFPAAAAIAAIGAPETAIASALLIAGASGIALWRRVAM